MKRHATLAGALAVTALLIGCGGGGGDGTPGPGGTPPGGGTTPDTETTPDGDATPAVTPTGVGGGGGTTSGDGDDTNTNTDTGTNGPGVSITYTTPSAGARTMTVTITLDADAPSGGLMVNYMVGSGGTQMAEVSAGGRTVDVIVDISSSAGQTLAVTLLSGDGYTVPTDGTQIASVMIPSIGSGGGGDVGSTYGGFVEDLFADNADFRDIQAQFDTALRDGEITDTQYDTLFELAVILETPDPLAGGDDATDDATSAQTAKVREVARMVANATGNTDAVNALVPGDGDNSVTDVQRVILRTLATARNAQLGRLETIKGALASSVVLGDAALSGASAVSIERDNYGVWLDTGMISVTRTAPPANNGGAATYGKADLAIQSGGTGPGIAPRAGTSATYDGDAEGYAALSDGSASGQITANVYLEATFGNAPAISGNVDDFRFVGQGGTNPLSGWDASLGASFDGDVPVFNVRNNDRQATVVDETASSWDVDLYTTASTGAVGPADKQGHPTNALGQFDLTFTGSGRAVGAFDIERKRPGAP
ncbi:MAG: hypothetical protein OXD36_05420 [Rhodobacter sp.]|nr:hypothetical protein [Rhodobacter sp.]